MDAPAITHSFSTPRVACIFLSVPIVSFDIPSVCSPTSVETVATPLVAPVVRNVLRAVSAPIAVASQPTAASPRRHSVMALSPSCETETRPCSSAAQSASSASVAVLRHYPLVASSSSQMLTTAREFFYRYYRILLQYLFTGSIEPYFYDCDCDAGFSLAHL